MVELADLEVNDDMTERCDCDEPARCSPRTDIPREEPPAGDGGGNNWWWG